MSFTSLVTLVIGWNKNSCTVWSRVIWMKWLTFLYTCASTVCSVHATFVWIIFFKNWRKIKLNWPKRLIVLNYKLILVLILLILADRITFLKDLLYYGWYMLSLSLLIANTDVSTSFRCVCVHFYVIRMRSTKRCQTQNSY